MTEPNPLMKKKREASLSQEPEEKHTPPKRIWHYHRKFLINLNPNTLFLQRNKRFKATKWSLSLQRRPEEEVESEKSGFQPLGKIARLDKSLEKFVLSVSGPFEFDDKDLHLLAHGLKGLKGLQSIILDVGSCCDFQNRGLSYPMKELARLPSLKSLVVDFPCSKVSDAGLSYTGRSIKKMAFLKDIFMDFSDLPQATNKGMSQMHSSLNRLRRLENITLMNCALSQRNCNFPFLRRLGDFPEIFREFSQMTDESLKNMKLERLISLRSLYLDFGFCDQLTDKSLDLITPGLKKLPHLQSMKLKFWDCDKFTDAGLHNLWEIMNSLPSLQEVTLQFKGCCEITDAAFDDMNRTLKNSLVLIKKFHMEFCSCSLTDHGLVDLCKVLKRAVSLENLSVYWKNSDEITNAGVKEVIDCMNQLTQLRRIGLDFFIYLKSEDTSWNEISQFLESRTSLEKITLGVIQKNLRKFWAWIKEIQNLRKKMPDLRVKCFIKPYYKVELPI